MNLTGLIGAPANSNKRINPPKIEIIMIGSKKAIPLLKKLVLLFYVQVSKKDLRKVVSL